MTRPTAPAAQVRRPPPLPSLDAGSGGARQVFSVPAWASWIGGLAAAAFVITVVAVLVWHFVRNHWLDIRQVARDADRSGEAMSARREDVIAALDEGIARLAGDGDARSAVIACWVRLEEVAQAAGTPRAPSDAPADLVTRLLGAHQVSTAALTSLADLYRAARYSTDRDRRLDARAGPRRRSSTIRGPARSLRIDDRAVRVPAPRPARQRGRRRVASMTRLDDLLSYEDKPRHRPRRVGHRPG